MVKEEIAYWTVMMQENARSLLFEKPHFIIFIFQISAGLNLEHGRTVLKLYTHGEGRFFIQVKTG